MPRQRQKDRRKCAQVTMSTSCTEISRMVVDRWGKLKTTYATRNRSPRPQFRCIPTFTRLALHMVAASSSEYRQTLQIEAGTRTHLSLGSLNFDLCLAWFWAKINIIPRFPGFTRRTKFGDSRFDSFFLHHAD